LVLQSKEKTPSETLAINGAIKFTEHWDIDELKDLLKDLPKDLECWKNTSPQGRLWLNSLYTFFSISTHL
jgi:hypothetical protein